MGQSGIWESQDPRTTQWKKYNDNDMVCVESAYQEFVRAFIDGKCENFGELSASVDVNIEGLKFAIDIRENRQKNSSGGSRKIRRRRLNFEERRKIAIAAKEEAEEKKESDKEEQDVDNGDGDVAMNSNSNMKTELNLSSKPMPLEKQKSTKVIICPMESTDEYVVDDKIWSSFDAPLNSLMAGIINTTAQIKTYCVAKRSEMKQNEKE